MSSLSNLDSRRRRKGVVKRVEERMRYRDHRETSKEKKHRVEGENKKRRDESERERYLQARNILKRSVGIGLGGFWSESVGTRHFPYSQMGKEMERKREGNELVDRLLVVTLFVLLLSAFDNWKFFDTNPVWLIIIYISTGFNHLFQLIEYLKKNIYWNVARTDHHRESL